MPMAGRYAEQKSAISQIGVVRDATRERPDAHQRPENPSGPSTVKKRGFSIGPRSHAAKHSMGINRLSGILPEGVQCYVRERAEAEVRAQRLDIAGYKFDARANTAFSTTAASAPLARAR